MKRKLLQVNSSLGIGSTGKIIESICSLAAADGWECSIAHGARYAGKSQFNDISISSTLGEYLHFMQSFLFDRHGLGSAKATRDFVRHLDRTIKPDIIHLHNIHGYYINYEILFDYLNKVGIPVVWTFHDCWPLTGHCAHYENVKCDRWMTGCHHCPNNSEYPSSIGWDNSEANYRYKSSLFDSLKNLTIVAVSEWMERQIQCSYLQSHETLVISNGVDTGLFKVYGDLEVECLKEKLGINGKRILLGVAGVWGRQKGLQDFFILADKLPSDNVIVLVGLSREQCRNLPSNVIGIENTDNAMQLAELYSAADVFVNPTYGDTFPTTNVEALACGTPVVTYRTGGSPECLTPETGLVVDVGSVDGLQEAIGYVLSKGRGAYRNACRQRVEDYYEKTDRFKEYLKLYNRLVT